MVTTTTLIGIGLSLTWLGAATVRTQSNSRTAADIRMSYGNLAQDEIDVEARKSARNLADEDHSRASPACRFCFMAEPGADRAGRHESPGVSDRRIFGAGRLRSSISSGPIIRSEWPARGMRRQGHCRRANLASRSLLRTFAAERACSG